MNHWLIGMSALLCAAAAQGSSAEGSYAKVGDWEITTESEKQCSMTQIFESNVADDVQGLIVVYDAKREGAVLSWAGKKPKYLLASGSLNLELDFQGNSASEEKWSSKRFDYTKKANGTYHLNHVVIGKAAADRILRDIESHEGISLFLGSTMIMSLPLGASEAVAKLRDCAAAGGLAS
jgi:hypothetical protein